MAVENEERKNQNRVDILKTGYEKEDKKSR